MKLIKLTDEHYVIVDDSKQIQVDDKYLTSDNRIVNWHKEFDENIEENRPNPITHSTEPLGIKPITDKVVVEQDKDGNPLMSAQYVEINMSCTVKYISLQEVKELIGEKNLKKIAEDRFWKWNGRDFEEHEVTQLEKSKYISGFVSGYNQALEDNKDKKYTEEDMLNALYSMWYKAKDGDFMIKEAIKASIDYVKPKTEWEVEIVDGKLKLL